MRAGLRNGAYFVKPRPFFFTHVVGIRAYMLGRCIVMKAVGMWHWEVEPTPDAYSSATLDLPTGRTASDMARCSSPSTKCSHATHPMHAV